MKKWVVTGLFVLCAATSAFAAETTVAPAPAAVTADAVITAAPMTLTAALDKVARNYREMWIPDREGKKLKRACDFQCTQACSEIRQLCIENNGSTCWDDWEVCMCWNDCCNGPQGNPYCGI